MSERAYRIFVINPGSTSTKVSMHEGERCLFSTDVFHDSSELLRFPTIPDQFDYRMSVVRDFLRQHEIDLTGLDAVVGRGGPCRPVEGGTYLIDDRLIQDTLEGQGGLYHASMLGASMARAIHDEYGGLMLMVDPPVVDELSELARVTGVKGIHRRAVSHALNLKATARRHAETLGRRYEDCRLIVCHIDGGISITAHLQGRMVDGNNAGGGEGPLTPTRMGSMAVTDLLDAMADVTREELRALCSQAGGFTSYFGTSNAREVHRRVEAGDPEAFLVWNAMIYQIAKEIGAMAVTLSGQVDGIVLTGGITRFTDVVEGIRQRCGWIAPVTAYPGEMEHEAMAAAALRVLRGEEQPRRYAPELR